MADLGQTKRGEPESGFSENDKVRAKKPKRSRFGTERETKNPLDATNSARKLVISNIPDAITPNGLREFFNVALFTTDSRLKLDPPVINAEVFKDKDYAIIEFRIADHVQTCQSLDGCEYLDKKLKITPFDKFTFPSAISDVSLGNPALGLVTTQEKREDNKIYMGGIPTYLGDDDVRQLAEAFGELKQYTLIKDPDNPSVNKGYAFFEFVDASLTDKAIRELNGMKIHEKKLKVQRASVGARQNQNNRTVGAPLLQINSMQRVGSELVVPPWATSITRVIRLNNVISAEDLISDEDFSEIKLDIKTECERFGAIEDIQIPRPDKVTGIGSAAVGKIFVKFRDLNSAKIARYRLSGRKFNGRTVVGCFFPEEKFETKELTFC
eukprot:CAMPEP_0115015800 /NCGR_PEP_ID=MMETSP0216-20121206/27011_1 /TAXON_ID=223996 /ORGANISM="Protocruzia adherens, Strain Boccale" /LENGTH=381 /DNA_ID=CAMNT_0002386043 /DNA_START=21 /DNA_END=1166 /DNA_ORIENTATION=-